MNDITITQMCEEITAELQKNAELPDDERQIKTLTWDFSRLFQPYCTWVPTMRSTADFYGISIKAKRKQMYFNSRNNWRGSRYAQCIISISPVTPEDGKLTISEAKRRYETAEKAKQDAEKRQKESNENKFLLLLTDCNISFAKFRELESTYSRLDYDTQRKIEKETEELARK